MSYQDAVNAFAYRKAAQQPHFRPQPGTLMGPTDITIHAGRVDRLKNDDLVVYAPYHVESHREVIETHSLGSSIANYDPAFKNHDIDYTTDARLEGTIIEGFHGSDVTPPDPDTPAVEVTVKCGTCAEDVTFLVSITDAIRGTLETGK
jgi:hypothetical protein